MFSLPAARGAATRHQIAVSPTPSEESMSNKSESLQGLPPIPARRRRQCGDDEVTGPVDISAAIRLNAEKVPGARRSGPFIQFSFNLFRR